MDMKDTPTMWKGKVLPYGWKISQWGRPYYDSEMVEDAIILEAFKELSQEKKEREEQAHKEE